MVEQNKDITINYNPSKNNLYKIKIFSDIFVKNNIYKCKIIYKDQEYELKEYINDIDKEYDNKNEFTIKLRGINNLTDISYIFKGCKSLTSFIDKSNFDISRIINMENMFYECESLLPLHITSNLNNSNSANMNQLFLEYNKIKLNK